MEVVLMKKVIAIILVLVLSLSVLAACGGLEDPPPLPPPRERDPNAPIAPVNPTPVPPPGDGDGVDDDLIDSMIPGNGGTFLITETTEFKFIPAQSGLWEIFTSDNGSGDPYLELYDQFGFDIWEDDDGGGDNDARIIYVLKAGTEYKIRARFWSSSYEGSFTLRVSHVNPPVIPVGGGSAVVTEDTIFSFIPNASGSWEFKTSDNGRSDPVVELLDENGDWIMGDDDSGGDRNALFTAMVNEGTQYYISARFWFGGDGEFTLNVTAP